MWGMGNRHKNIMATVAQAIISRESRLTSFQAGEIMLMIRAVKLPYIGDKQYSTNQIRDWVQSIVNFIQLAGDNVELHPDLILSELEREQFSWSFEDKETYE